MTPTPTIPIQLRLTPEQFARLERVRHGSSYTKTALLRHIVDSYLDMVDKPTLEGDEA